MDQELDALQAARPQPGTCSWWFGRWAQIGADETLLAGQQVFTQRTDKAPCQFVSSTTQEAADLDLEECELCVS